MADLKAHANGVPKDAWMSLKQGSQALARPVRVSLSREHLEIYGTNYKISNPLGQQHTVYSQLHNVQIRHKSVQSPHPRLLQKSALNSEAVAHHVLFSDPDHLPPMEAIVLASSVSEVSNCIGIYIELLLTKNLEGALPADSKEWFALVSSRATDYCTAVLSFTGICLNSEALSSLLKMVSTLGSVDSQQAELLKRQVAKSQAKAEAQVKTNTIRADLNKSHSSKFGPKVLQNGITINILLEQGFAEEFAEQVAVFHQNTWRNWNPLNDASLAFQTAISSSKFRMNPVMFDYSENPHFLSVLFTHHIFSPGIPETKRAHLLKKWILIAHKLYTLGDFVGWSAIMLSIYDTACLRLTTLWTLVTPEFIHKYTRDWKFECFEIRKRAALPFLLKNTFRHTEIHPDTMYSKNDTVPYFVDVIVREGAAGSASVAGDIELTAKQLQRLSAISASWQSYLKQLPDTHMPSRASSIVPDENFQFTFAKLSHDDMSPRQDLMALSHTIQPKFMGYYLSQFYHQVLPLTSGSMLPVLFTQSVPNFCLFPRSTLLLATLPKQANKPQMLRRSSSFPSAAPPQITGITELDSDAREQLENTASAHVLAKAVRDLLNVGTHTIETKVGIVFKSFDVNVNSGIGNDSQTSKKRGSRTSSIIETYKRRSSYRSSTIGTPSLYSDTTSQLVWVKSASLVRLVDVLVLGAGVFAPGCTLDTESHVETLLATFRSFCSAAELLDMLQVRVKCCRSAARRLSEVSHFPLSSNDINSLWQPEQPSDPVTNWAVTILGNIISLLANWVSNYFFDFSDDAFVMCAGRSLVAALVEKTKTVEGYPQEIINKVGRLNGSFWRHQYSRPINSHSKISDKSHYYAETETNTNSTEFSPVTAQLDDGLHEINTMINEMDIIVANAFGETTTQDWMKLFEILELQTSKRVGLFLYSAQSNASENEVVVQNVYSWLATLQSNNSTTNVIELVPESISTLVRLHSSFVVYFAKQIADPTLTPQERRDRMVKLQKLLGILRTRMKFLNLSAEINPNSQDGQHIPSFLESALVSAILLPESRAFANSWLLAGQDVAKLFPNCLSNDQEPKHGHGHDKNNPNQHGIPNLRSIFIPTIPPTSGKPVTICAGWIIERFLEIVCCVPNISIENSSLINFDKRRYAYNLVKNMCGDLNESIKASLSPDVSAKYGLFRELNSNRNAAVILPLFDRKSLKESVSREGKARNKVFTDVISQEIEKSKAEAKLYDRLERASTGGSSASALSSLSFYGLPASHSSSSLSLKRTSKLIQSSSITDVSSFIDSSDASSINTTATSATLSKRGNQHTKKSRLGGLFKSVRPLSVLGGYSNSGHGGGSSGSQISFPHNQTAASFYRHPQNSNTSFQEDVHSAQTITSAHSDQQQQLYQLQQLQQHQQQQQQQHQNLQQSGPQSPWVDDASIDLGELPPLSDFNNDDWHLLYHIDLASVISVAVKPSSETQITFKSGKENETISLRATSSEFAHNWSGNVISYKNACLMGTPKVFGIPLEIVCKKENRNIPAFLETLLLRIEDVGLTEVGIYRISGSLGAINSMKSWFDSGNANFKNNDPKWNDVNAVAGCIKLYLRELPESLLTQKLLPEFLESVKGNNVIIAQVRSSLKKLPNSNYCTLRRLISHLKLIVQNSDQNKMNVHNIAIVFGVNFLPPVEIKQMGTMQNLVKAMVEEFDQLFIE